MVKYWYFRMSKKLTYFEWIGMLHQNFIHIWAFKRHGSPFTNMDNHICPVKCGIKLLIHSQTSRTRFSGSIFWLDIQTLYSDSMFRRDNRTRYSDAMFGLDIRTRYSDRFSDSILRLDSHTWILNLDKSLHPTHYNGCNYKAATEFTENRFVESLMHKRSVV